MVIAGAGFAGVRVAKLLQDAAKVTVVAPTDRFVYLPLIHELVSEKETPPSISKHLAQILPNARLVEDRVESVEGNTATTASGDRIPFDHFVHAAAAQPNDFGVPGVREHTFSFYSIRDALMANGHLKAAAASVYARKPRVLIVGASFTGVEVAGEVRDLMEKLDVDCEIHLFEAGERLFPKQSNRFRAKVHEALDNMNVQIRFRTRIRLVNEGVLIHGHPARAADTGDVILWCAGAKPRSIQGVDAHVRPTLQSAAKDNHWVVGDAAEFPAEAGIPRLAQTAEQQAYVAAHNILFPDAMQSYVMDYKGIILSIGRNRAVAELANGRVLSGRIPWEIKRRLYKAKIRMA